MFYANSNDLIILISSSGKSQNILNAAQFACDNDNSIITFTGFERDNPLKAIGDINFWIDSKAYNIIEFTHMFLLVLICDLIIVKMEYNVS